MEGQVEADVLLIMVKNQSVVNNRVRLISCGSESSSDIFASSSDEQDKKSQDSQMSLNRLQGISREQNDEDGGDEGGEPRSPE